MISAQSRPKFYVIAHRTAAQEMISKELSSQPFELVQVTDKQRYFDISDDNSTGCALVDVSGNPEEALETIAAIRAKQQRMQVIAFSEEWKVSTAVKAIQLGALEVCETPASGDELVQAIEYAVTTAKPRPREKLLTIPASVLEKLNLQEASILRLIVLGLTAKEASALLDVSVRTFHYRKQSILEKLGANNRRELIEFTRAA